MSKSSEMFLELRAKDVEIMYDSTFTKKDAILTGKRMVDNLLESGEVEPLKVWANICRLKEVVNSADTEFRNRLEVLDKENINGVEFNYVNGGNTVNYADDEVWIELKAKLATRESLLKVALNGGEFYDEDGVLVPKVSTSPRKSSITVKF